MKFLEIEEDHPFIISAKRKRGRNETCWCGLKEKYKHCHYNKERKAKAVYGQILHRNDSFFKNKTCLHPITKECKGKRIKAHTVQKGQSIKSIVDDKNHVLSFKGKHPEDGPFIKEPHLIGWNDASTFFGFCEFHDSETFKPLELCDFTATPNQCFLLYYRALCHENYQKESLVNSFWAQKETMDNGQDLDTQIITQLELNNNIDTFNRTIDELKHTKDRADRTLTDNSYGDYSSLVIEFTGNLNVCGTGHFLTDQDVQGNVFYDIYDPNVFAEGASLSLIKTQENEGAFIITWPKQYYYAQKYAESIFQLENQHILTTLLQVLFGRIENVYFNPLWWENLNIEQKNLICGLANEMDYNFSNIELDSALTSWQLKSKYMT